MAVEDAARGEGHFADVRAQPRAVRVEHFGERGRRERRRRVHRARLVGDVADDFARDRGARRADEQHDADGGARDEARRDREQPPARRARRALADAASRLRAAAG